MKKLALVVTRGSHNNLAQVASLIMGAAVSDVAVRVLFRDEAVLNLTKARAGCIPLSQAYEGIEGETRERYQKARMDDIRTMLREAKQEGDVKLYACTSSLFLCGVDPKDLIPEIDEPRGLVSFLLEEMEEADQVLSF